jgi:hypothetical protein
MADVVCTGYVRGFIDGVLFGYVIGTKSPNLLCPPKAGISAVQGRLIVKKYLKEHPETLHEDAGSLVATAFVDAFRCR